MPALSEVARGSIKGSLVPAGEVQTSQLQEVLGLPPDSNSTDFKPKDFSMRGFWEIHERPENVKYFQVYVPATTFPEAQRNQTQSSDSRDLSGSEANFTIDPDVDSKQLRAIAKQASENPLADNSNFDAALTDYQNLLESKGVPKADAAKNTAKMRSFYKSSLASISAFMNFIHELITDDQSEEKAPMITIRRSGQNLKFVQATEEVVVFEKIPRRSGRWDS